jgi:hypothetical protein
MKKRFKGTMSKADRKSQKKMLLREAQNRGNAQEYYFDYNTVEAVLLGCAIFTCLCGIMFESGSLTTSRVD